MTCEEQEANELATEKVCNPVSIKTLNPGGIPESHETESGFATKTITKPSKTHFSGVRKQLRSMILWLFLKLVTFNMSANSCSLQKNVIKTLRKRESS